VWWGPGGVGRAAGGNGRCRARAGGMAVAGMRGTYGRVRAGRWACHRIAVQPADQAPSYHPSWPDCLHAHLQSLLPLVLSCTCSGRQVAIDVAEALAYLHGQNVLHGDICAR